MYTCGARIETALQQFKQSAWNTWWRHQMETFSALLAICAGNSPVPGEFPTQRPVTRSFDVYFDLRPDKRLSKQSWGWWFETLSHSLWRHRNDTHGVNAKFLALGISKKQHRLNTCISPVEEIVHSSLGAMLVESVDVSRIHWIIATKPDCIVALGNLWSRV